MSKRPSYIESHSALRGIAALTVFLGHLRAFQVITREGIVGRLSEVFDWGSLAVFLFFILSGFVMSHVYPSPVRWGHFSVARFARLFPVYEVTTFLLIFLIYISGDRKQLTASNLMANLLMTQQWLPVPGWNPLNPPSWSLSVETLLYACVFPLLVWSRNLSWKKALYFMLLVVGVLWGTIYYNYFITTLFHFWRYPILTGLAGFCLGFAIHGLMDQDLKFPRTLAFLGFTAVVFSLLFRVVQPDNSSHGFLAVGLVLLVVCSVDPKGLPYRILARPDLIYLGDISYSLYLWHLPVMMIFMHGCAYISVRFHALSAIFSSRLVECLLIIIFTFAVSTLSYYKLEVPFRRLIRDRFVRPKAGATLQYSPS